MTPEEMKAKLQLLTDEAWNKGNMDVLADICAADVVSHSSGFPDLKGLAAYKQMIVEFRTGYPDCHLILDEIIAEGNTVAARYTARGAWTGPSAAVPLPPTGKQATESGVWVGHFANGKIAEDWYTTNLLGWLQQIGVIAQHR